ncbi:MAG: hypothetical protein ACKPHU_14900 [Planctomycetaceae bacterium]
MVGDNPLGDERWSGAPAGPGGCFLVYRTGAMVERMRQRGQCFLVRVLLAEVVIE